MNSPKSERSKKLSPTDSTPEQKWYNRIDYWQVIQRAGKMLWDYRRRLIVICILLVLTGGQAVTLRSSPSFSGGSSSSSPGQNNSENFLNKNQDWRETLKQIENKENFERDFRNFVNDKGKLYGTFALASIAVIIIAIILLVLFSLNSYFHLLLIRTVQYLDRGKIKPKKIIQKEIHGRWKDLLIMRILFGLIYLATLILFFAPAGFFAWQRSWALAIAMSGAALISIFIVFMILSYVFRYSLLYFAASGVSMKAAIDKGHDLFMINWKESILASLINFALGMAAAICGFFIFLTGLLIFAIIGGTIGLAIYFVLGMAHPWGIAIGVGIVGLILLIIAGIILAAFWQGFVVIFWFLVFKELAGCKVESCEKVAELAKEVKAKKPAAKPVVQKEE